jgi:predicted dehydrogenase
MTTPPVLALVGGGRWARIYLSVLAAMPLPFRLVVVSHHGADRVAGTKDAAGDLVTVVPDLDALLSSTRPAGAILANAAMAHGPSALRLLEAGVPVLVEKPAAVSPQQAAAMVRAAERSGAALMPALTYLHCAYLETFAKVLHTAAPRPATALALDWADSADEARYGERKDYDRGIGLALDVMPHVWAILASVLGRSGFALESCLSERGGRRVAVRLRAGSTACEVRIEREAPARRRAIRFGDGPAIDFTAEPGTIHSAAGEISGDPSWSTRSDRPVRRQVEAFLRGLSAPPAAEALADLEASVRLAHDCDAMVKEQQRRLLANTAAADGLDADAECALRELLAPALVQLGRLQAGDDKSLQEHVRRVREGAERAPAGNWLQALSRAAA